MKLNAAVASSAACKSPPWRAWWLVLADGSQAWNLTRVESDVSPSLNVKFLPAPPGDYFLRLVLSSTSALGEIWNVDQVGAFTYDTQQFSINPGPVDGFVVVNPPTGAPITTTFHISTDGWID